jgi:DNA-binding NtrC family response regulator
MAEILREDGYTVHESPSAEDALEKFGALTYDVLVTDLQLPGRSGVELTRVVHKAAPATAVVLVTGHATVKTAVTALQHGASDYIKKPVDVQQLRDCVRTLADSRPDYLPSELLAERHADVERFEGMVARSRAMRHVFEQIRLAAQSDATLLVTGESGTGKELVARALHRRSRRAGGPFVAVHTGAIPPGLIASELFGHERGAFTGAVERKAGQFELAAGGTLFLDEISTMDAHTQINLLRVLESFTYVPVGGKREQRAEVRVVAATNRDLRAMCAEGRFREDLYFRLNVLAVVLPPLRERREDIVLVASEMAHHHGQQYGRRPLIIPPETQRLLEEYPWPGNVRELRNVVEQATLLARGPTLDPELLPHMIYRQGASLDGGGDEVRVRIGTRLADAERDIVLRTLEARDGNKKVTAELLGISRRALYNKLASYARRGTARRRGKKS